MSPATPTEPAGATLSSVEEALDRVLRGARRAAKERVPLELARGRVLAEDVVATTPIPPHSFSLVDGFAVDSTGLTGDGPWALRLSGSARAGYPSGPVRQGQACRIFTGAEIPAGADAVVMQEDTLIQGPDILVLTRPRAGQQIRAAGSEAAAGTKAMLKGMRLSPGKLGLAAHLDRPHLVVSRRPVVAVLSTGDELRSPGDPPRPASVVESSAYAVCAWAEQLGAVVRHMPMARDNPDHTRRAIERALRGTDLLVTIGGVGAGEHDWVRPTLTALGASLEVSGVALSPGRPFSAGRLDRCRISCLPGHPAGALVCFVLFVAPLVRALQGDAHPLPRRLPLRVVGAHVKRSPYREVLRAVLEPHDQEVCAVLLPSQSPGAVMGFAEAEALVEVPAEAKGIRNGERLPVIPLDSLF